MRGGCIILRFLSFLLCLFLNESSFVFFPFVMSFRFLEKISGGNVDR